MFVLFLLDKTVSLSSYLTELVPINDILPKKYWFEKLEKTLGKITWSVIKNQPRPRNEKYLNRWKMYPWKKIDCLLPAAKMTTCNI